MDAASRCPAREPGAADGWPDARPRTSRRGPEGATAYAAQPPEVPAQAYRARPRGLPSAAIPDRPTAYSYQPVRRTRLDPRCRPAQWRPARVRHRGTAGRVLLARPGGRAATTGTVDEPRGGFVSILKLPGGRYAWRHREGGRHLKKTFARRADAAAWDARVRADVARGTHVDLSSQVTVAEYAHAWSAARVLRPGTRRIHDVFLRHHVEGPPGRPPDCPSTALRDPGLGGEPVGHPRSRHPTQLSRDASVRVRRRSPRRGDRPQPSAACRQAVPAAAR